MTTFQAILYGIVHGFSEFLPVSSAAHGKLVAYMLGWPAPEGALTGALALGGFLAGLIYFRHDWASIISSFLQVIIFRKKPMTLDERLPLFLALTALPAGLAWFYSREWLAGIEWTPPLLAAVLVVSGMPLLFAESFGRKNKGMFDWSWFDCLFIGVWHVGTFVPGWGQITGALQGSLLRNYNREAAAKYGLFALTPILGATAFLKLRGVNLGDASPAEGLSWLSFAMATATTFFTGLLAIGGLMRQLQKKSVSGFFGYRLFAASALIAVYWLRNRA